MTLRRFGPYVSHVQLSYGPEWRPNKMLNKQKRIMFHRKHQGLSNRQEVGFNATEKEEQSRLVASSVSLRAAQTSSLPPFPLKLLM